MKIKKKFFALLIASTISFNTMSAGIPVFDGANASQMLKDSAEQLKQWSDTVVHYKNELLAYKDQLVATSGIKDVVAFTKDLKSLHGEMTKIYEMGDSFVTDFTQDPEAFLSNEAKAIFTKYGAFDMCDTGIEQADNLCKANIVSHGAIIHQSDEFTKRLTKSMENIDKLATRIDQSKDIKESQDLANSIQAQQLQMQALKMQYEFFEAKNKAQAEIMEKQRVAQFRKQQAEATIPTFDFEIDL